MVKNIQKNQYRLPNMLKIFPCAVLLVMLSACANYDAPVSSRVQPPSMRITTHVVAAGDTLYSIAWRNDVHFRLLARANDLSEPYHIQLGQRLTLDTQNTSLNNPAKGSLKTAIKPSNAFKPEVKKAPVASKRIPKPLVFSDNWTWKWPIQGKTVESFSPADLRKGISIKGVSGAMVRPAAPGTVVYAGDGLRGYGKLVIIKHSDVLLSAYGHNEKIMVKEGQVVRQMEIIAKLGIKGTMHFEIRKDGYPVNPTLYLR